MMNIVLPAYSRNYSALRAAGEVTPADEMENQELEQVVLRERGVVWADQEGLGEPLKGAGVREGALKANEADRSELAPVLCFSNLLYHQNSPCSKSSYIILPFFC